MIDQGCGREDVALVLLLQFVFFFLSAELIFSRDKGRDGLGIVLRMFVVSREDG
jgi:hypothetical protein